MNNCEYYIDVLKYGVTKNELYMVSFKTTKYFILYINDNQYIIYPHFTYNIMALLDNKSIINFEDVFLQKITDDDFTYMNIEKYDSAKADPEVNQKVNYMYEVVYSFDKNYFCGAFASINSLVSNFDPLKINKLNINIIIGNNDVDHLTKNFTQCFVKNNINLNISLFVIDYDLIINESFLNTKCLKGGNHLLNVGNFGRLLIGKLFSVSEILYLDSDTIIQSDMSVLMDSIKDKKYIICGKKSNLTYRNILVSTNYENAIKFLGNNFDINKNIIYTGTILIRPKLFRQYYDDFVKITTYHNSLPDGLYKLFTMSILNLCFWDKLEYFDDVINNVVDLGHIEIDDKIIIGGDVLDWSGIYKPWFSNGYYKKYWKKYNIFPCEEKEVINSKDTIETNIKKQH
jgi:lipopolysaccharide biosynthesis glycosyltransferase